jgi:hypothetical protein
MLVVPLAKDSIVTKDGAKYKVVEYTNYKEGGPAVYAKLPGNKDLVLVYFFDIESINSTRVEYQKGSKIFHALGKITRTYHLPQPDDKIVTLKDDVSDEDADKNSKVEVEGLKLKSKSLGINKGLFIKDVDGEYYRLKQVFDIIPALGGNDFSRDKFLSYYKDYTGV